MGLVLIEKTLSLMKNTLALSKSHINYPPPPEHNVLVVNLMHHININSSTELCTTKYQALNMH